MSGPENTRTDTPTNVGSDVRAGLRVAFAVDDFVVARRTMGQVPAVGEIVWIGKYRYRVAEVTWFLDDEDDPDAGDDDADVRLLEAGRPGHPEIITG